TGARRAARREPPRTRSQPRTRRRSARVSGARARNDARSRSASGDLRSGFGPRRPRAPAETAELRDERFDLAARERLAERRHAVALPEDRTARGDAVEEDVVGTRREMPRIRVRRRTD